jgi:TonB family protein
MASSLIRHAAHNTPPSLQARLEEEWMAEIAGRTGRIARLLLALGCWWAASVIAREWAVSGVAATTPGSRSTAAAYAAPAPGFLSPRTAALILIACLHLALIYFLAIGLGNRTVAALPPPIGITVRKEPPTAPPAKLDRIVGGPGKGFPATADYYPDASRRLGEQGAAAMQVCVDPRGRLTSEPTLIQSSGSARVDGSARTLARAGSGHYRATTEDGQAVSACFQFRIRFELATPHDARR